MIKTKSNNKPSGILISVQPAKTLVWIASSLLLVGCISSGGSSGSSSDSGSDGDDVDSGMAELSGTVDAPIQADGEVSVRVEEEDEPVASTSLDSDRAWSMDLDPEGIADNSTLVLEFRSSESSVPLRTAVDGASVTSESEHGNGVSTTISSYSEAAWLRASLDDAGSTHQYIESHMQSPEEGRHGDTGDTAIDRLAQWIRVRVIQADSSDDASYKRELMTQLARQQWPAAFVVDDVYEIRLPNHLAASGYTIELEDGANLDVISGTEGFDVSASSAGNGDADEKVTLVVRDSSGGSTAIDLDRAVISATSQGSQQIDPSSESEVSTDTGDFHIRAGAGSFEEATTIEISRADDPSEVLTARGQVIDAYRIHSSSQPSQPIQVTYRVPDDVATTDIRLAHLDGRTKDYSLLRPVEVDSTAQTVTFEVDSFSWYSFLPGIGDDDTPYGLESEFSLDDMEQDAEGVIDFVEDRIVGVLESGGVTSVVETLALERSDVDQDAKADLMSVLVSRALLSFLDLAEHAEELRGIEYRSSGLWTDAESALDIYAETDASLRDALLALGQRSATTEVSFGGSDCGARWQQVSGSYSCFFGATDLFIDREDLDAEFVASGRYYDLSTLIYQLLQRQKPDAESAVQDVVKDVFDAGGSADDAFVELANLRRLTVYTTPRGLEEQSQAHCLAESAQRDATEIGLSLPRSSVWAAVPGIPGMILGEADNIISATQGFEMLGNHLDQATTLVGRAQNAWLRDGENWTAKEMQSDLGLMGCSSNEDVMYIQADAWERLEEIDDCLSDLANGNYCGAFSAPDPEPDDETPLLHPISVEVLGTGGGNVNSTPSGVSCRDSCEESVEDGSQLTLEALPDEDSSFEGWDGACSGTSSVCNFTVDRAQDVTATFSSKTQHHSLNVDVDGNGQGTVVSTPSGIDCGTDCNASFEEGELVELEANSEADSSFAGWDGACEGASETCLVEMDDDASVVALFSQAEEGGDAQTQDLLGDSDNGINGPEGFSRRWSFEIDDNVEQISIIRLSGTDNLGFALSRDQEPQVDCFTTDGGSEICTFENADYDDTERGDGWLVIEDPIPGTYNLLAYGFADFDDVHLWKEVVSGESADDGDAPSNGENDPKATGELLELGTGNAVALVENTLKDLTSPFDNRDTFGPPQDIFGFSRMWRIWGDHGWTYEGDILPVVEGQELFECGESGTETYERIGGEPSETLETGSAIEVTLSDCVYFGEYQTYDGQTVSWTEKYNGNITFTALDAEAEPTIILYEYSGYTLEYEKFLDGNSVQELEMTLDGDLAIQAEDTETFASESVEDDYVPEITYSSDQLVASFSQSSGERQSFVLENMASLELDFSPFDPNVLDHRLDALTMDHAYNNPDVTDGDHVIVVTELPLKRSGDHFGEGRLIIDGAEGSQVRADFGSDGCAPPDEYEIVVRTADGGEETLACQVQPELKSLRD